MEKLLSNDIRFDVVKFGAWLGCPANFNNKKEKTPFQK